MKDKMRELPGLVAWKAFEKWAAGNHAHLKHKGKDYIDYMWDGWAANEKANQAELARLRGALEEILKKDINPETGKLEYYKTTSGMLHVAKQALSNPGVK